MILCTGSPPPLFFENDWELRLLMYVYLNTRTSAVVLCFSGCLVSQQMLPTVAQFLMFLTQFCQLLSLQNHSQLTTVACIKTDSVSTHTISPVVDFFHSCSYQEHMYHTFCVLRVANVVHKQQTYEVLAIEC